MSGGSCTLFLCEAVPASPSLTRYLAGIGVVGVLVYMCSVGGVVSVVVSRDGSWALGCYEGEGDDVFFLEFAWVSVGHGTVGGAVASFGGPLPGSGSFPIAYEAGSYEQCDGYDEQVKRFLDPVYAADQDAAFMRGALEALHPGR